MNIPGKRWPLRPQASWTRRVSRGGYLWHTCLVRFNCVGVCRDRGGVPAGDFGRGRGQLLGKFFRILWMSTPWLVVIAGLPLHVTLQRGVKYIGKVGGGSCAASMCPFAQMARVSTAWRRGQLGSWTSRARVEPHPSQGLPMQEEPRHQGRDAFNGRCVSPGTS